VRLQAGSLQDLGYDGYQWRESPLMRRKPCVMWVVLALLASLACSEPTSVEEGLASFYADSFHGSETASGEEYNKRADTAAHRTLAFGTRVKVTNLENGKSVWVRINDRGPHVEGRIIDLSGSAARKLGITKAGTAKVRVEIHE
jgi:rare lipoprotein A